MLKSLKLSGVGPAESMEAELAPRLNVFTGDNGLGKSFLLDVIWWCYTGLWPHDSNSGILSGRKAMPQDTADNAEIVLVHDDNGTDERYCYIFNFLTQEWERKYEALHGGGDIHTPLVIYGMVDGSFAILDPARYTQNVAIKAHVLTAQEVWEGKSVGSIRACNGMIQDWCSWQTANGAAWELFCKVLETMSPEGETIEAGTPTRVDLDDARDMPTIRMPYSNGNDIPIIHASSAVKRILSFVYVLLWTWKDHLEICKKTKQKTAGRIAVLWDEIEAHLHPRWQRTVLRSLFRAIQSLPQAPEVQLFVSTHSPLVMASCEDIFDTGLDAWLDLDLEGNIVKLTNRVFRPHGDANAWLASDAFDMRSLRSVEGQSVVDRAAAVFDSGNPTEAELRRIADELDKKLGELDPFRNRWFTLVRAKFPGVV